MSLLGVILRACAAHPRQILAEVRLTPSNIPIPALSPWHLPSINELLLPSYQSLVGREWQVRVVNGVCSDLE